MNDLVVPDASTVIYDSAVGGLAGWTKKTRHDHLQYANKFGKNVRLFKITVTVKCTAYMHASGTQKL